MCVLRKSLALLCVRERNLEGIRRSRRLRSRVYAIVSLDMCSVLPLVVGRLLKV